MFFALVCTPSWYSSNPTGRQRTLYLKGYSQTENVSWLCRNGYFFFISNKNRIEPTKNVSVECVEMGTSSLDLTKRPNRTNRKCVEMGTFQWRRNSKLGQLAESFAVKRLPTRSSQHIVIVKVITLAKYKLVCVLSRMSIRSTNYAYPKICRPGWWCLCNFALRLVAILNRVY